MLRLSHFKQVEKNHISHGMMVLSVALGAETDVVTGKMISPAEVEEVRVGNMSSDGMIVVAPPSGNVVTSG